MGEDLFTGRLNVLLVEDNPDHAELAIRALEQSPLINSITHVSDGEEALAFLFRRGKFEDPKTSPRPHVILLDLRLPKIDGLEVLSEIKKAEHLKKIPVVVLTSSKAGKDVTRAYGHHVNSYLVKPLDVSKFTKLLSDLKFYWLSWKQKAPKNKK
jgi:CheY-like chemotaxis protein